MFSGGDAWWLSSQIFEYYPSLSELGDSLQSKPRGKMNIFKIRLEFCFNKVLLNFALGIGPWLSFHKIPFTANDWRLPF